MILLQRSKTTFKVSLRPKIQPMDAPILALESALRALFAKPRASRACPTVPEATLTPLTSAEKAHAGALMRINHVGEVCAQALYTAQGLSTSSPTMRAHFAQAAKEETDHLAWTAERLTELGARPSLLNPLWYGGAFALGLLAGRLGDAISLGFVEETEKQVAAHLQGHLQGPTQAQWQGDSGPGHTDDEIANPQASQTPANHGLPAADLPSRAIVAQMRDDEAAHARVARQLGAQELPFFAKQAMARAARVMTRIAYKI